MEQFLGRCKKFLWTLTEPEPPVFPEEIQNVDEDDDLLAEKYMKKLETGSTFETTHGSAGTSIDLSGLNSLDSPIPESRDALVDEIKQLRGQIKKLSEERDQLRLRARKLGAAVFESVLTEN